MDIKFNLFLVMSDQTFVLSDQDGVLCFSGTYVLSRDIKLFAALNLGMLTKSTLDNSPGNVTLLLPLFELTS